MMYALFKVGYFLFDLIFNLLFLILWARIALRYFRVNALHPISQPIYRLTNPIVAPLQFFSKQFYLKKLDLPCFIIIVLLEVVKFSILFAFLSPRLPWLLLPIYVVADLIIQPLNLLFYTILLRIILSFVNPMLYSPFRELLTVISEPIIVKGRKFISENKSGFDIAPYFILVALKAITIFISFSLPVNIF